MSKLNLPTFILGLIISLFMLNFDMAVYAEGETSNDSSTKPAKSSSNTPASQNKTVVKLSPQSAKALPDPTVAANKSFDSAKEARLEDLRYKHLWLAYSMVWIVIFVFIRQTWQRSQAVSGRLEELKSRLIALEEKEK